MHFWGRLCFVFSEGLVLQPFYLPAGFFFFFFSQFQCLCFHYSVSRLHTVGLYLDFAKRRTDSEVIYISCNITCHVFKCSNLICNLVWTVDIHTKIALSFYIRSETVNSWLIQLWIWELGGLLYLFLLHLHTSAQYFCHTLARLKKGWSYVKLELYWTIIPGFAVLKRMFMS